MAAESCAESCMSRYFQRKPMPGSADSVLFGESGIAESGYNPFFSSFFHFLQQQAFPRNWLVRHIIMLQKPLRVDTPRAPPRRFDWSDHPRLDISIMNHGAASGAVVRQLLLPG
ncbi:MAG: hypothetical protein JJU31_06870 [Wenzhouxiangella sp.]|nr:hypothetical protein [Wenzhouxiangella sp.]MCH8478424.1 hypothetical protein [Wenzhouxiangella sp.]